MKKIKKQSELEFPGVAFDHGIAKEDFYCVVGRPDYCFKYHICKGFCRRENKTIYIFKVDRLS